MIRFAWLQTRTQTLIACALFIVLAAAALVTGVQLSHLYTSIVAHCQSNCGLATQQYLSHDDFMDKTLDILARAVPALFGLFWGAPLLAREFEAGTYRLVWTQSVTRKRWLLTRVAVASLATLTLASLFSLTVTWWYHSRDKVGANIYDVFDRRDIAPVGYALFAFAAGLMFGAVIRRTVPAMAAALGLFVFARIAVDLWVRPHLLAAHHAIVSLARQGPVQLGIGTSNGGSIHLFAQVGGLDNSWTQASHFVTQSGQALKSGQLAGFLHQHCAGLLDTAPPPAGPTKIPANDPAALCLDQVTKTFELAITYHPSSQYWTLQWLETGVFLALALIAATMAYWRITHRTR